MAMPPIHDATTGFHDIKALPDFPVSDLWLLWLAAALLGIILIAAALRKKKVSAVQTSPVVTPEDQAYSALRELERMHKSGQLSPREFSSTLSLAVRSYLETAFSFPATDSTSAEVMNSIRRKWKKVFSRMAPSRSEEVQLKLQGILAFCDRVSFADDSERFFSNSADEFLSMVHSGRDLISTIADQLTKERISSAPVSDHSRTSSIKDSAPNAL